MHNVRFAKSPLIRNELRERKVDSSGLKTLIVLLQRIQIPDKYHKAGKSILGLTTSEQAHHSDT